MTTIEEVVSGIRKVHKESSRWSEAEAQRSKRTEVILVSSLLEWPTEKPGPHTCSALAYAPDYWDCVEAAKLAEGINKAMQRGRPTHPIVVGLLMDPEYKAWVNHPMFKNWLPLVQVEADALPMIQRYQNKRIVEMLGKAYGDAFNAPHRAREVAKMLITRLEVLA